MVVQLAFDDGAAIVDALALPDLRSLALALTHTTVVGHALSADLKIFAERFDLVPPRVFDTQVAAAFLGYGMQVSLADLVRGVCGVRLTKSQTVSDWSARPLSERQIEYLVGDVAYLLPHLRCAARAPRREGAIRMGLRGVRRARRHRALSYRRAARIFAHSGCDAHEPPRARHSQRVGEAARRNRARARSSGCVTFCPTTWSAASRRSSPRRPKTSHSCAASTRDETPARQRDTEGGRARAGARRSRSSATSGAAGRDPLATPSSHCSAPRSRRSRATPALPPSLLVPRATIERLAREVPQDRDRIRARPCVAAMAPLARRRSALASAHGRRIAVRSKATQHGDPKVRLSDESTSRIASERSIRCASADRSYQYFRLDALERSGVADARAAAFFAEDLARESLALRRWARRQTRRHRSARARRPRAPRARDRIHAGRAFCCKTLPACRASSIWRLCATPWRRWAAIRRRSIRCSPSSSSSTTRCRPITSEPRDALAKNTDLEFERNRERYAFLKWGQSALSGFRVVPPGTGIVHQVNIEYLARVVFGAAVTRMRRRLPIPTPRSAPIRTRRWSTASAFWPGASAASRRRRRCSVSP